MVKYDNAYAHNISNIDKNIEILLSDQHSVELTDTCFKVYNKNNDLVLYVMPFMMKL